MQFFSGFSLSNEEYLFSELLNNSAYTVSGFSYGAIKAFKTAKEQILLKNRVDKLQLISPAFFQTKDAKFKRLQLLSYSKNKELYIKQFIKGCFFPYEKKIVELVDTNYEELEELLNFKWNLEELQMLVDKGLIIEVYLGGKDTIIDTLKAKEFFLQISTVSYIKDANHFLQIK